MKKFLICALLLVTTSVILAADTSYGMYQSFHVDVHLSEYVEGKGCFDAHIT